MCKLISLSVIGARRKSLRRLFFLSKFTRLEEEKLFTFIFVSGVCQKFRIVFLASRDGRCAGKQKVNNILLLFFFSYHNFSNDGREFGGSIYQRCNDRLETGVQLSWASGSNATKFGIAAKYDLDKDAAVRAKVNNASQIGLGYQQKLRDGN